MPVPFETLLPYAIVITMFGLSGAGLGAIKTLQNEGHRPRYSLDQWDRQSRDSMNRYGCNDILTNPVMDRDRRLTGTLRGQVDNPQAPSGFAFSNGWRMEKRIS